MKPVHSVTASAPGKTNLFFAVGPLQEDGFHDVASVYLALDLREEVTVTPAASWSVSVTGNVSADQIASVPTDESNLVVKAAKHVAELAGVDAQPVSFTINKHVPVAGGMGGGSADAAAALAAVDALWCTGVEEKLSESVELGADGQRGAMQATDRGARALVIAQQCQDRRGKIQAIATAVPDLTAAPTLLLDRRAWHRSERTEHAAIARLWTQQRMAGRALVVELASVRGHGFLLCVAAVRTGQHGFEDDSAHRGVTSARWTDSLRSSWPWSTPPAGPCRRHR